MNRAYVLRFVTNVAFITLNLIILKPIYFNWISILIPFFIGLVNYKKFDKSLKLIFYYVLYGTINEIAVRIFISQGIKNTMPNIHLYLAVSFLLLGLFYYQILSGFFKRQIIIAIIVLFEVYIFVNAGFIQSIYEYPVLLRSLGTIIIMFFSLVYFYKVMIEAKHTNLWQEPLIWINGALLIYYSGNLFFTILFNFILEYSREFSKITAFYFSGIMTLFYILIAIGFWKAGNRKHNIKIL